MGSQTYTNIPFRSVQKIKVGAIHLREQIDCLSTLLWEIGIRTCIHKEGMLDWREGFDGAGDKKRHKAGAYGDFLGKRGAKFIAQTALRLMNTGS